MANDFRIFKTKQEKNTTDHKIKLTYHYVCDGTSHYTQALLEIFDDAGEKIVSKWQIRIPLGPCKKAACYMTFGFLPKEAEMKFLSISLIDPAYNKKDE